MFNRWNFNILEILLQPTANDLWLARFSTATIYSTDIPAPQQPSPAPIRIFKQAWQTPDRRDHDHWGEGQMRHTRENSEWCWTLLPFALGHWMLWKWASFMGPNRHTHTHSWKCFTFKSTRKLVESRTGWNSTWQSAAVQQKTYNAVQHTRIVH